MMCYLTFCTIIIGQYVTIRYSSFYKRKIKPFLGRKLRKARENLKYLHISGPEPEYGTSITQTSFANHNTMNSSKAEYLSRGVSVFFSFIFIRG